jgi:hypothetical protein
MECYNKSDMPEDIAKQLLMYCDLRPSDVESLRRPSFAHPRVRDALVRDGLLEKVSSAGGWRLTSRGRDLLNRAAAIETGVFRPRDSSKPISSANRAGESFSLDQADKSLLLYLSDNPAVAFVALVDQLHFPVVSLQKLSQLGLAAGDFSRGSPWRATPLGKGFLADAQESKTKGL